MDINFDNHKLAISALVGSWASNLHTANSDKDWKYFVLPTFDDLYNGLMYSDAAQSETFDYDVHDIRKLGELLWKANVNFVITLFSPEHKCLPALDFIFERAEDFACMNLPQFYSGTIGTHSQKMNDLLKGTAKTDCLVEKFGYDTKQATHAMRLLYILERFAIEERSMRESMWFEDNSFHRNMLLQIKAGEWTLDEFRYEVRRWHEEHDQMVKKYFGFQVANEALGVELNHEIKELIRAYIGN